MSNNSGHKTKVLVFSPALDAVSGVSTHVNVLLKSSLVLRYDFMHFQVGSEGRIESALQRLGRFIFSPLHLAAFIVWHRPNIVHINTSFDQKAFWRDFAYLIVARLLGRKVVSQVHSGSAPLSLFSSSALALLLKRFLLASHAVIVLSNEAKRSYKAFDSRIAVELVPNAIEAAELLEVERDAPTDGAPLKLVYMGRIIREKGIYDSLSALKLLKEEGIEFTLQIAGAGPDETAVREFIEELGLGGEVTMLGPVYGKAKSQLWLSSDIQVLPTYFNEGLPYAILESLAAGCVPITCSIAAIPDVIQDGVHGIFVPAHAPIAIASAIRQLSANRDQLLSMSLAGRRRIAERYVVDRLADQLDKIYGPLSDKMPTFVT